MNQNIRKTALMVGAVAISGLFCPPQAMAESTVNAVQAVQQDRKVTGTVVDAMGPVIGASVMEKGTSNGAVTDFDGNFSLNVKPGAVLVISYIGYTTQEILVGNQSSLSNQPLRKTTRHSRKSWSWVMVCRRRNSSPVLLWR